MSVHLVSAFGGDLVDLMVGDDGERRELTREAGTLPSLQLSPRALCDLELLAAGGLSPLDRFLGEADYRRVLSDMRLVSGGLCPIPLTLTVADRDCWRAGQRLALRSPRNNVLAVMRIDEIFERCAEEEAWQICATRDEEHPHVAELLSWGRYCLSGPLQVLELPRHYDFPELRRRPAQVRQLLLARGNPDVVAFQPAGLLYRREEELSKLAAAEVGATLLIHPAIGLSETGGIDHYTRIRNYRALAAQYYDPRHALLSLSPLAPRMAGPREAVWHAIVQRNYGANYMVVPRDYASPRNHSRGRAFYGAFEARDLVARHSGELGVRVLGLDDDAPVAGLRGEESMGSHSGARVRSISEAEIENEFLRHGKALPDWLARPETVEILAASFPPRSRRGFCIWFTGLPSAGKSTIAEILTVMLMERGRRVTLLDGDVVRTHLSRGLGFSREDRDTNILRIGFVASEIVLHGGVAIGAAVSPYRGTRNRVRAMMPESAFIEVFVDTPIGICESRDVKRFYAKARAGEIKGFTGVDDPYEPPVNPEIRLETTVRKPEELALEIVRFLQDRGFVVADAPLLERKATAYASPGDAGRYELTTP